MYYLEHSVTYLFIKVTCVFNSSRTTSRRYFRNGCTSHSMQLTSQYYIWHGLSSGWWGVVKKRCNDLLKWFINLGPTWRRLGVHCEILRTHVYYGSKVHQPLGGEPRTCFTTGQMHVNKDQTGNLLFCWCIPLRKYVRLYKAYKSNIHVHVSFLSHYFILMSVKLVFEKSHLILVTQCVSDIT